MEQIKVFISYAHADGEYFKDFSTRFKAAVANTGLSIWDDRNIHIGSFWDGEIQQNIRDCNVALLLVSMDFMASRYIREQEFEQFKNRYEEEGVLIVPVSFAPSDFQRWPELAEIQFFKPGGGDYGRPDKQNDFTYADLVKFKTDGTALPNPDANRYVINLVKKIEDSFAHFQEQQKRKQEQKQQAIVEEILSENSINRLAEAPRPRLYFTGREKEIIAFKAAMDNPSVNLIAIDGPGGIGKTQFVSECIRQFIPADKIIWYVCTPASHLDTIISEAGYPELIKGNKKDTEKFSAFKDKIQQHGQYLFLDNFQETNSNPVFHNFLIFIQSYLKAGCVIVLDRDILRDTELKPIRIHIEGLQDKQLEYAKNLIVHSYQDEVRISDDELLRLCEQLHGHPLAIDLAMLLLSEGETTENIIAKIAQRGSIEQVSDRLLNAIFSRPDASQAERDFITQFSIFTSKVPDQDVNAIIPETLVNSARGKLRQKNLLQYSEGYYEIHPLVREYCYRELKDEDKTSLHTKAADYYIGQRTETVSPALEEQIFYHLVQSRQWERIDTEIEVNGRKFIIQGQLGLVKELLEKLINIGINKPVFSILNGDIARIQGRWGDAQEYYNIARNNDTDKKVKIDGTTRYADGLMERGAAQEAFLLFKQGYDMAGEDFVKERVWAANGLAVFYGHSGELKTAIIYYNEAIALAREIEDNEIIATCLLSLGTLFVNKGEYDEGLKYCHKALDIFSSIHDKVGIASVFCQMGEGLCDTKKYNSAFRHFEQSLSISKDIGYKKGISQALNGMGEVFLKLGQLENAKNKNEDSKKIAEEIGDKFGISSSLNNIALILEQQGKIPSAISLYEKSLAIKEDIGDLSGIAIVSSNLGAIYARNRQEYFRAVKMLFKSIAICNKIEMKSKLTLSLNWLTDIRRKMGLVSFKELADKTYLELSPDLQQYLHINELTKEPIVRTEAKIGRNDQCHCGSGKKYKQCHGKGV